MARAVCSAVPLARDRRCLAAWLCLCAAALLSCSGAQFDGTVYQGDGFVFRIPPPPDHWERIDHSHAALAFRDPESSGTIMINGRCGLDGEDVPLTALTNHLFLQFTDREIHRQEVVPFDGREAMHTELTAKLDGVPMRFDVWVLKKDGCVYDLIHLAPPAAADRGSASFTQLVKGFSTVGADGN